MAAPFNRIRSKLNRAICAYLIQQKVGTSADTFPENWQQPKGYPVTIVRAGVATPAPVFTGNRDIPVHISIKGSATGETKEPLAQDARLAFEGRLASVYDALMQSDDNRTLRATARAITAAGRALATSDPANNPDMADFTVQLWVDGGEGDAEPDQQGTAWEEILVFRALCSPSNVD